MNDIDLKALFDPKKLNAVFCAALVRMMGGVHSAVAFGLAVPREEAHFAVSVVVGFVVYCLAEAYLKGEPFLRQVKWAYLLPLGASGALWLYYADASDLNAATATLTAFYRAVWRSTPWFAYFAAAGCACLYAGKATEQKKSPLDRPVCKR